MKQSDISIVHEGFTYYYRVIKNTHNTADPIFFISGAFQNMDSWKKFIKYFSAERTVILIDLPGAGRSDFLPPGKGLDFLANSIYKVLCKQSISKCCLMAASYGAPIAYRFAQKYPQVLSGLVLGGTMKEIPSHLRKLSIHSLYLAENNQMEEFASLVINKLLCTDETKFIARRKLTQRLIYSQLKNMSVDDIAKFVSNTRRLLTDKPLDFINSPKIRTLIFTGEHDVFTLPQYGREMAAEFQNAAFTTVKHCDHLLHLQQFPVIIELINKFSKKMSIEGITGCNPIEYFTT